MANEKHVQRLNRGVAGWNAWRADRSDVPDLSGAILSNAQLWDVDLTGARLSGADLSGALLEGANLSGADLRNVNLSGASLGNADLTDASLGNADLSDASLFGANLTGANLTGATMSGAVLRFANLTSANLTNTNLTNVLLAETVFADLDLTSVIGLERCKHDGPSVVDHRTLQRAKQQLPLEFLRGVGLPDRFIDYIPSLFGKAIQYYSCFISYSSKDEEFAQRIHADLQGKGVRCWFAQHDLPIGGKILDEIDAAIRLREKVVLILSEHSIKSDWVEDEVSAAFEEERARGQIVLFPIRLDDAVMDTNEAWAAKLRARHIGDFRHWKDHDGYKRTFERVLRDLSTSLTQT